MIQTVESDLGEAVVIADMEAGLEHLSWAGGTLRHVDLLLIVIEPYVKSLVTASRTHALAEQLHIPKVALIANRVRPEDAEGVGAFAASENLEIIARLPDDPNVQEADEAGKNILDHVPDSPVARAIDELARSLESRFMKART